jgi:homoserine kinase type II
LAVLTDITEGEASAFLAELGLEGLTRLTGIPAGSVNSNFLVEAGGVRYFLRIYEEQGLEGARREGELLDRLARGGVLTPAPLGIAVLRGKPAAVFPWLEGGIRCQRAVTSHDCRAVGRALARVHVAGQAVEAREGRFEADALRIRLERIAGAPDRELASRAAPLGRALERWIERRDPALPKGLIHGDLFRDNVLWSREGELRALLDFESASRGVFAYDLMVTLLAWCFGSTLEAELARAMVAGYREVRELSAAEARGLLAEGCTAAVRFTITRITDYAMRVTASERVVKDWRRFAKRLEELEALGESGLGAFAGI